MKRTPLKRKTPLRSKTPLEQKRKLKRKRKTAVVRGSDVSPEDEIFGELADFIRNEPCYLAFHTDHRNECLAPYIGMNADPDHVKTRGAGGKDWLPNGDGNLVPACRIAHGYRSRGIKWIRQTFGVDLARLARYYGERFRKERADG